MKYYLRCIVFSFGGKMLETLNLIEIMLAPTN